MRASGVLFLTGVCSVSEDLVSVVATMGWNAKGIEAVYTLVKIGAIFGAAGWTYYQWDRVFFPEAAAEQRERASLARPDVELKWNGIDVIFHGDAAAQVAVATDKPKASRLVQIVEISGVLSIENLRPYPVSLNFGNPVIEIEYGLTPVADDLQVVSFKNSRSVTISSKRAFLGLSEEYLEIESKGLATIPTRILISVDPLVYSDVHQYRLFGNIVIARITEGATGASQSSKTKVFTASVLFNGTSLEAESSQLISKSAITSSKAQTSPSRPRLSIGGAGAFR